MGGPGGRLGSALRGSRRRALRLFGRLGLGLGGAVVLAACDSPAGVGDVAAPTDERTKATPVDTQVSAPAGNAIGKEVTAAGNEQPATRDPVEVVFATDSVYGPRGAAMQWGLQRFAELRPEIFVKLEPRENIQLRFFSDSAPHVVLTHQHDFLEFQGEDVFTEVTDLLHQMHVENDDYYFMPDTHTFNDLNHSFPPPSLTNGPQYGMPFQFEISGFVGNMSLAEIYGVEFPASENSWTWDDWTEWDAKMTDADAGTYGTWARQDYHYQYLPQMYSNGLKKPFDDALTKTMFDQPEALEAWDYLISKVTVHRTSPTADQIKTISGKYREPFAAGKIGIWPSGRAFSTGYGNGFIQDRFTWTLLPEVVAERGGPPGHSATEVPNLVTSSASRDGLEEQSLALAVFLAGEEFQGRVGVERGHMPVHKAAIGAPESVRPPPEGMKWLKVYADRPDNRGPFPFSGWQEWGRQHWEIGRTGWLGEQSPAQALEACQAWGIEYLSEYDGPKPFVREPVYP